MEEMVEMLIVMSREFHSKSTEVVIGDVAMGEGRLIVIAGPCSGESPGQTTQTKVAAVGRSL